MRAAMKKEITELVPSVSIDNLLSQRDAIIERLHGIAKLHDEITELSQAAFGVADAAPALECRYTHTSVPNMESMIKRVDATAWQHLMSKSGLRTFMDAKTREQWDKVLHEGHSYGYRERAKIPKLTRDNIRETFAALYAQRGKMFEDGVVNCFRQLSWDYKTNNPYLFGRRIILERILDTWTYSGKTYATGPSHAGSNKLDDLLRVMMILDDQPEQDHRQGAYRVLSEYFGYNKSTSEPVELAGMISIRCFKNGNGHVTFLRSDLVNQLNEIVRRHHPHALPARRAAR